MLLDRGLSADIVRILLFMYEFQNVCTKWNDYNSSSFSVTNGVPQGGVLSSLLFDIYMDVLLACLRQNGIGCYLGYHFVGAIAYADHLTLICPLCEGLQKC